MANHLNDDIKIKFLNKKIIRDYKMNNKPATCESGNPTIALQYLPCIGGLTFLFMTSLHNLQLPTQFMFALIRPDGILAVASST